MCWTALNWGGGRFGFSAKSGGGDMEAAGAPSGDSFARPARLLPLEAKALVAAIDLFGDHLPQAGLQTARDKIVKALGHDPSEEGLEIASSGGDDSGAARTGNEAIARRKGLELQ